MKWFSTPIIWILGFQCVSILVLKGLRKQSKLKVGWYFLIVGTCLLFILSLAPVSNTLIYSLESQYQPLSEQDMTTLDIIVILSGGVYPPDGLRRSPEASGATYSRSFNGVNIFKQSNAKVLVLSGGGREQNIESEAEVMKKIAMMLGVPEDKIVTEPVSRNTLDQAIELAKIFPPSKNNRIGIVTSALHMPRAVQAFQVKFPKEIIVPIPVGYIYSPLEDSLNSFVPTADAFMASNDAIHEKIGMIWYRFMAWRQKNMKWE